MRAGPQPATDGPTPALDHVAEAAEFTATGRPVR